LNAIAGSVPEIDDGTGHICLIESFVSLRRAFVASVVADGDLRAIAECDVARANVGDRRDTVS
jgi:hypothetical protein